MAKIPEAAAVEVTAQELKTIAQSIGQVADALDQLRRSGLKSRAILVLIHDMTSVPMSHIKKIIECAGELRATYLEKK